MRWFMQLFVTGGQASWARSVRLHDGFAMRSSAVSCKTGGRASRPGPASMARMASSWTPAASAILPAFPISQFVRRLIVFVMCFSTFVCISSIAETGAPIVVRRSSISPLFLK